jgi:hypothetical protein
MWGLPGVVACASVAGATIEHFIFAAREIDVAQPPGASQANSIRGSADK